MNEKRVNGHPMQFLYRPGRWLGDGPLRDLVGELREVAAVCFEEVPEYQVLQGSREELSDKVLSVARRPDGSMAGFCSTVLLPVPGVGEVLHLGLTCVRPEDRRGGLTHRLMKKAVVGYLVRHRPLGRVWITNCAAVLSSLGNVALYFDSVFPSPFGDVKPSGRHHRIAREIGERFRRKIYIREDALFDRDRFVFRGSVKDTVFQKSADDRQFHHRDDYLNRFHMSLMNFSEGDEVLQVGHVSALTAAKHTLRRRKLRRQATHSGPGRTWPGSGELTPVLGAACA